MASSSGSLPKCVGPYSFTYGNYQPSVYRFDTSVVRNCDCNNDGVPESSLPRNKHQRRETPLRHSLQLTIVDGSSVAKNEWRRTFSSFDPAIIVHLNFEFYPSVAPPVPPEFSAISQVAQLIADTQLPSLRHFSFYSHHPGRPYSALISAIIRHAPKLVTLRFNCSPLSKDDLIQIFACGRNLAELEVLAHINDTDAQELTRYIHSVKTIHPDVMLVPYHSVDDNSRAPHDRAMCNLPHYHRPFIRLWKLTIALPLHCKWSERTIREFRAALPRYFQLLVVRKASDPLDWSFSFRHSSDKLEYYYDQVQPPYPKRYTRSIYGPDTTKLTRRMAAPMYPLNLTRFGQLRSNYRKRPAGKKHQNTFGLDDDLDDEYDSDHDD
ncbi:hypothetical protein GQ42DRAFT_68264 [Ramicandelaber brevisporus]|nr:hypothetical protein GQ42DRAFT_68264 [Ramicandelaber brevisporus]